MASAGNILVILGAGASYDVVDPSRPYPAAIKNIAYRPPLTDKLFTEEGFAAQLLPEFPVVRELAATIRHRTATRSLEAVLRELSQSSEQHRKSQMLAVPLYLNRLLYLVSEEYVTEPANYTHLIGDLLEHYERVAFVTLNYDLLLDWALTKSGHWGSDFTDMATYVRDRWLLVKLHGSVNWGRKVPNSLRKPDDSTLILSSNMGFEDYIDAFSTWPPPGDIDGQIVLLPRSNSFFAARSEMFYPALSIPVDRKYDFNCPPEHIDTLRAFLPSCRTVLSIGCSGKDGHVLDLLRTNLDVVDVFCCVYKGPSGEDNALPPEHFGQIGQLNQAKLLEYDSGFTEFLRQDGIAAIRREVQDSTSNRMTEAANA